MIAWSKYFNFNAEDVEHIEATDLTTGDYRFKLSVHFKSGNQISVNYLDAKSRDSARVSLVGQIDRARREDVEKLLNQLTLLNYSNERIERRQLRIWRQLKALLGISMEEE